MTIQRQSLYFLEIVFLVNASRSKFTFDHNHKKTGQIQFLYILRIEGQSMFDMFNHDS